MIAYILISVTLVFSGGFIISAWYSSKTIAKQMDLIELYENQIVELQNENNTLQNQVNKYVKNENTYPIYSNKV